MSAVFWQRRKSRLSVLVDQPGGISVGVALDQANRNLQALKSQSESLILGYISELVRLSAPASDRSTSSLHSVYALCTAVIAAAGPFDRDDLCTAAAGLCDLIDTANPGAPFDWRIVTVHAQAMQLIVGLADDAATRTLVMDNLRQLVALKASGPGS